MSKIEAHVVLGYTCNSRCKHCVVQIKRNKYEKLGKEKLDLTSYEAKELINDIINKDIDEIVISGGEPTLRKDIIDIVNIILKFDKKVQIQTNGTNPHIIKELIKINPKKNHLLTFMIPIHSSNYTEHNYIAGNPTSFQHTIKSLKCLQNNNIKTIGKIVVTKLTGNLAEIVELYRTYGVNEVIITYPHCVSFPVEKVKEIDLRLNDFEKKLLFIKDLSPTTNIILQAIPFCYTNKMYDKIQENDQTYLERDIIEYKYRDNFEYKWHDFRLKDKRKFLKCKGCKFNNKCEGIWKEYIKVYGEE